MNEWIYILGKCWEAYLYHSIWWNEQFPTCSGWGRRGFWELHFRQHWIVKALPGAGLSMCSLGIYLCNPHRTISFLSCFQLGCSDVTKCKNWAAVFLWLEFMHVVERGLIFVAQVESAYCQLEKKSHPCVKKQEIFLGCLWRKRSTEPTEVVFTKPVFSTETHFNPKLVQKAVPNYMYTIWIGKLYSNCWI